MQIILREATASDARGIARVHVESWKATYRGLIADEYIDSISYADREQLWAKLINFYEETKQGFLFVASVDDEIVGFVSGGRSRDDSWEFEGEVTGLYILKQYQRMGFGRRLMNAAVSRLLEAGVSSMSIWVLEGNDNAIKFYERLGGRRIGTTQRKVGNKFYTVIGYGCLTTSSMRTEVCLLYSKRGLQRLNCRKPSILAK